jgi:hypothetical protein
MGTYLKIEMQRSETSDRQGREFGAAQRVGHTVLSSAELFK